MSLVHTVWEWLTPPTPVPGMGTCPRSKPFRASCSGPQRLVPGWAWNPTTVTKKAFRDVLGGPVVKTALPIQKVRLPPQVREIKSRMLLVVGKRQKASKQTKEAKKKQ